MTTIYFLVDKPTGQVTFSGPLPEVWETITGLTPTNYTDARDLGWAGQQYAGKGFLTYEDALGYGIPRVTLEEMTQVAYDFEWSRIEPLRAEAIQAVRWRIDRYNDYVLQGTTPPEPVEPLLAYVQTIRDFTVTYTNPFAIVWPIEPALPA
jgi:hypothetical protein